MTCVVGVVGASGSGKTTIVNALVNQLALNGGDQACAVIAVDDYYQDLAHLSFEAREVMNFDHPDAIDKALLLEHLDQLRRGIAIDCPCYDFTEHTRLSTTRRIEPAPLVFIEGVLAASSQELRDSLDHVIFVDTREYLCLERRIIRDKQSRARSRESVIDFWETRARPMFKEYVMPSKAAAALVLSGEDDQSASVARILQWLDSL